MSNFCLAADELRRRDYERFLCGHLAPTALRAGFHTVLAFNLELVAVSQRLQEALLGEIRLQWWRDCLASFANGRPPAGHPLAAALAGLVAECRLSPERLSALIEGRAADLDPEPPADMAALLEHADATAGNLNLLLLEVLGCKGDLTTGLAMAQAWALLGTVRNVPFDAAQGRLKLPRSLLMDAGIGGAQVQASDGHRLAPVAKALCVEAQRCLAKARSQQPRASRSALPVLMCGVLADGYIRRLARAGFDPFAVDLRRPAAWDLTRFYVRARLGRY
ncbi:MAG: squalene/phytoene synthase family protein [Alphaproteobacteria bacterium]|jgi:phytoene synthase|nr:squalene/phytoene synthase family protein [Alphaproteobacteria bacterium]